MKTINLRVLYPDAYKSDYYVEVPDEVAEVFETFERMEKAYMQRVYYHKAYYTLDCSDEIEHSVVWYRQVLCANSFTSLAELSLHRAGKPALNYLVAEDRERVKGGEAACEALDVSSVFCYQPASSSCISMCFMLMYFFPPHWVPAT